jgi:predicted AlkP superfamily phosphohydrolase/phosphomutase
MLEDHGIPATIVHMPVNYPPVDSGEALAGMGTPDLQGTQGTFTYYTDDPGDQPRAVSGGLISRAEVVDGRAVLHLDGPPNSLRRDRRASSTELIVDVDPGLPLARVIIGDSIGIVREGEWSDWLAADFPLLSRLVSVRGMVRVFAKQLHPRFEVYISPINVDPETPALPISTPPSFSREISRQSGRFYTLGIPEDTSALRQGVFDLPEFLSQSHLVLDDERKLLDYSLEHFRDGLLFFYFSSIDQSSHMLWGQHEGELLKVYRAVDAAIGEALLRKPSAEVMVMSDHGFASFDRSVDLNRWLYDERLLALKKEPKEPDEIDWARTRVYALGLNGLYLNLAGRERQGQVHRGQESQALIKRVREKLLSLRDPANGRAPIETVAVTNVTGENARIAPDLIVGYSPGYRASWQTGVGGLSSATFEDNTDAWIADHCINAADVPGVLFTTSKVQLVNPGIKDLPVSLLARFNITPDPGMTGHSIYGRSHRE